MLGTQVSARVLVGPVLVRWGRVQCFGGACTREGAVFSVLVGPVFSV
jgi:hypothetical protein